MQGAVFWPRHFSAYNEGMAEAQSPHKGSRSPRRWASLLILVVVIALGVRLAISAWLFETAPGLLSVLIRDATLGWFGRGHEQINSAPGSRQAEFWLVEADRV